MVDLLIAGLGGALVYILLEHWLPLRRSADSRLVDEPSRFRKSTR